MPFQSEKQRRYLHANHPEIAKRWEREYATGGILDINESEEIISDDGNDIELTAYNAAFDDPNDLSTGVKTLFMKKGGQAIGGGIIHGEPRGDRTGFWDPGGKSPGTSSTGGMRGETARETGIRRAATQPGPTTRTTISPPRGGGPDMATVPDEKGNINEDLKARDDEEQRKAEMLNLIRRNQLENPGREDLLRTYPERMNDIQTEIKEKWRRKIDPTLWEKIKDMPTLSFVGIISAVIKDIKDVREIKKDMAMLEELGLHKGHPSGTDTAYSQLQDYLAERKFARMKEDDPENNEGPEPIYTPLTGEVSEEYAQGLIDPRDWMAEIRAKQAARAAAVPDWQLTAEERELKNNPIVMTANSGGLANLFRVKNQ